MTNEERTLQSWPLVIATLMLLMGAWALATTDARAREAIALQCAQAGKFTVDGTTYACAVYVEREKRF
jgi:hypothetical protein